MRTSRPVILSLLILLTGGASLAADPARAGEGSGAAEPQARTAPATGDPSQTATFKVFLRGAHVGSEQITVSRTADGWLIAGSSTMGSPVTLTLRRAEIRYSEDWRPLSLSLEGNARGEPLQVQTRFADGRAVNRVLTKGEQVEKTDTVSPDVVALPNNFFGAYTALAVRLASVDPGGEVRAYVAPQAEIAIGLRSIGTQRMQTASRAFELQKYRISIQNPGATLDAEVWAETGGALVRFSLPSASLDVVREDVVSVAARTQTYHREGDEDIRIPATGFSLAGTLSKPSPAGAAAGPLPARLPAIVLVAGSGPVDRDQVVAGIPVFGQLANGLAGAGFLVLRYDKRGVGQSGGRPDSATLQDYAEDVRAVVLYLSKRKDVDPKRIYVAGHSEGAWAAMLAASREKRIARVVLMGAPATTGAELILAQQRHLLERSGLPEAERQAKTELQKKIQQAVLGQGSWEGIPDDLRRQADSPGFASLLAFDPAGVMPRVSQPVLIVQGELDTQVSPENAARLAELANGRKKNPGVEVVRLPGVNHLLVPATTGEVDEYESLPAREVSPQVAEEIARWLRK